MQLFEVTVQSHPSDVTLLVVAANAAEACALAGSRGMVRAIGANHGSFTVRGHSRIIGDVEKAAEHRARH